MSSRLNNCYGRTKSDCEKSNSRNHPPSTLHTLFDYVRQNSSKWNYLFIFSSRELNHVSMEWIFKRIIIKHQKE